MLTNKNMSGGVKLGYIEATTNELAMLMVAMGFEEGTEQREHCSRTVTMKQKTDSTTCRAATTNSELERQHFAHVFEEYHKFGARTAALCTRVQEIR